MQDQSVVLGIDKGDGVTGSRDARQEEIALVLNKSRRFQLQATRFPKSLERDEIAGKVIARPLLQVDIEHIRHDGRQIAVVPLVPRRHGDDILAQQHAHLRHYAIVNEIGIALLHRLMRDGSQILVFEVVVRRVAVGLHTKRELLSIVAYGDKAAKSVEAAIGLFQIEQETVTEMMGVVDVDRSAQTSAVVGGATAPVEAHVVGQKHGDGAEVYLSKVGCIELKAIPEHKRMTGRRTTKRSRGNAARAVSLDENRAMLNK